MLAASSSPRYSLPLVFMSVMIKLREKSNNLFDTKFEVLFANDIIISSLSSNNRFVRVQFFHALVLSYCNNRTTKIFYQSS